MRLKIDVMEREYKNLEFGREVNKTLVSLLQISPLPISKKKSSPLSDCFKMLNIITLKELHRF
jgi:hypothetical protein